MQQGDPLGPLLFALALQPLLEGLPGLVVAYADDVSLIGSLATVDAAFGQLRRRLKDVGLDVNPKKTYLWHPHCASELSGFKALETLHKERQDRKAEHPRTLVALGVPVAGDVHGWLQRKVRGACRELDNLERLGDSQCELHILRAAGPLCRIAHLLRAIPRDRFPVGLLAEIDGYVLRLRGDCGPGGGLASVRRL